MKKCMTKAVLCSALLIAALSIYMPLGVYAAEIKKPEVDAHGAVLIDFRTGRVLWEKDSHEPLANASTTKIMTAIIAIEKGSMDTNVTVSKRAAAAPPVKMGLSEGETISLRSLLLALMLQSSNDAAVAIAEHIGGSVEEFCNMMTEKAKKLGAINTNFQTPNGLDADDHASTAYDMALITRYALNNSDFIKIIKIPAETVSSSLRSYSLANKNRLLNEYEGATGVKTGYTGKAGHCFVGAAKRGDMQLISVVLASGWGNKGKEQKWTDTKRILDFGFKNFKYYEIIDVSDKAAELTILRTKTPDINLFYMDGLCLPLTAEEKESLKVEILLEQNVKAPVEKGDKLGTAKIIIGSETVAEIALCAENSAQRHDLKTCIEKTLNILLGMTTQVEPNIEIPEWYYSE